jgi:four helix bundle protein
VPSNIAEGQARGSTKEFVQFVRIAYGSLQETETQLMLARRFGYLSDHDLDRLLFASGEVARLTNGLVRSLLLKHNPPRDASSSLTTGH